jgi:hypothetical protein
MTAFAVMPGALGPMTRYRKSAGTASGDFVRLADCRWCGAGVFRGQDVVAEKVDRAAE